MSYFRELPDLEYQSPFADSNSSQNYVRAKNLFRRIKLRDDLKNVFTLFNKYQIPEGARPDTVAEEVYGKADYDWVVLLTAGIINVRDEWPLSNKDLYAYAEEVYGNDLMPYIIMKPQKSKILMDDLYFQLVRLLILTLRFQNQMITWQH